MKNENTIPAVEKTLLLMELLCRSEHGMSLNELNKQSGVTASTGYRIMRTLANRDWVCRNRDGKYEPSNGLLLLAANRRGKFALLEKALPILESLAEESRLTCKLSIRQWNDQVSVLRAESPEPFAVSGKVGGRFPVMEGSVGAALLCMESEENIRNLVENCSEPIAEKKTPALIFERIAEVKKKGYVLNMASTRWKVHAMSMPVSDGRGGVAGAVTLLGTEDDFNKMELKLAACLKKAVQKFNL